MSATPPPPPRLSPSTAAGDVRVAESKTLTDAVSSKSDILESQQMALANSMAPSAMAKHHGSAPPTPQSIRQPLSMTMGPHSHHGQPPYHPPPQVYSSFPNARQYGNFGQHPVQPHQYPEESSYRIMNAGGIRRATFPGPSPSMVIHQNNPHSGYMRSSNLHDNHFIRHPSVSANMPPRGHHEQVPHRVASTVMEGSSTHPSEIDKKTNRSFPVKLHKMLSTREFRPYISWLPHGRAFKIRSTKGLEEGVLPKFFRSARYESFMRQVNGWGFKRVPDGPDQGAYYHEMFLRGVPDLCTKMKRPAKGGASRATGETPNFYKISIYAPLPEEDVILGTTVVSHSPGSGAKSSSRPLSPSNGSTSSISMPETLTDPTETSHSPIVVRQADAFMDRNLSYGSLQQQVQSMPLLNFASPSESYAESFGPADALGDLDGFWASPARPGLHQTSAPPSPTVFQPVHSGGMPSVASVGSQGDGWLSADVSVNSQQDDIQAFSAADLQYLTEQNKYLLSRQGENAVV